MAEGAGNVKLVHILNAPFALQYIAGQPRYMRRHGIEEIVVTPAGPGLHEFGAIEGIPVHSIPIQRRMSPAGDLRAIGEMVRLFREESPEIVHGHTPKGGLLGLLAATIARVPVRVYTLHGLVHMTATGRTRTVLKTSDRIACALADRVICVSESVRQVAVSEGVCSAGKITVLGSGSCNGVDAAGRFNPANFTCTARAQIREQLRIPADALVLVFIGRIVGDKGVRELAAAWADLRVAYPTLHMIMAGPIEERDSVPVEILDRLQSDARVHLTGLVEDVSGILSVTDVLAIPTYREGLGVAFIEAGAMEVPVVGTSIPGCVDAVVDGVTGTLIPPRDVPSLRGAITAYLDDSELRWRHGKAGRERVLRAFNQKDVWEATWQEYKTLLDTEGISRELLAE